MLGWRMAARQLPEEGYVLLSEMVSEAPKMMGTVDQLPISCGKTLSA